MSSPEANVGKSLLQRDANAKSSALSVSVGKISRKEAEGVMKTEGYVTCQSCGYDQATDSGKLFGDYCKDCGIFNCLDCMNVEICAVCEQTFCRRCGIFKKYADEIKCVKCQPPYMRGLDVKNHCFGCGGSENLTSCAICRIKGCAKCPQAACQRCNRFACEVCALLPPDGTFFCETGLCAGSSAVGEEHCTSCCEMNGTGINFESCGLPDLNTCRISEYNDIDDDIVLIRPQQQKISTPAAASSALRSHSAAADGVNERREGDTLKHAGSRCHSCGCDQVVYERSGRTVADGRFCNDCGIFNCWACVDILSCEVCKKELCRRCGDFKVFAVEKKESTCTVRKCVKCQPRYIRGLNVRKFCFGCGKSEKVFPCTVCGIMNCRRCQDVICVRCRLPVCAECGMDGGDFFCGKCGHRAPDPNVFPMFDVRHCFSCCDKEQTLELYT